MSEHVQTDLRAGVLTLTLARVDKKNALSNDMYAALADAIEGAESDPSIRVIVFRALGETFTAGNDIAEFAAQAAGSGPKEPQVLRFLRALVTATRPLVAAVQGHAVGVGTTMLLHCDYVLLAENAVLMTPFVNLALVPEAGSSQLMPALVGHLRAFKMFALGEPVRATEAVAWGLASRCVPLQALHEEARQVADRIAKQPAGALLATKKLMRDPETLVARMERENEVFARRLQSSEAREAFTAFARRRPPDGSRQ
ncbi:enoyl-CoA hydratase [Aquincola sp. S2]|uniref:Enoyl-CoA hydratase n=1 Tax=Pseudaquabacterium terrae TaxID=2732868 RepID=A0ABX2ET26_9BURK|nr:enoyl-CoA hydratase [Aquabacterium terrae]NRF71636.1 enoyl-CoA hydratase [Aquabacterium terrae]